MARKRSQISIYSKYSNMKEKKEQTQHRRPYVSPWSEVLATENVNPLLAGSPAVKPSVSIEDPTEDDDNTNLLGAKHFNMWEDWDR